MRVLLPQHLQVLSGAPREVQLDVSLPITVNSVLGALEARYPTLCGTIRDRVTLARRPLVRFFVCEEDISHAPPDQPLPEEITSGKEPFIIIGAIAGGVG